MTKITTLILASTLLIASFAQASNQTSADIDNAIRTSGQQVCELANNLKPQIDAQYAELGKLQMALDTALTAMPWVETVDHLRKAAAVSTAVSTAAALMSYKLGQGQFKSAIMMDLNQYALVISTGAAKISAIALLASQGVYTLTSSDIQEYKKQISQVKSTLEKLQDEIKKGCN